MMASRRGQVFYLLFIFLEHIQPQTPACKVIVRTERRTSPLPPQNEGIVFILSGKIFTKEVAHDARTFSAEWIVTQNKV